MRLPVRFLTMNETVIWAAPVELFSEIATDIRNRSPFPQTFYFGYTNGWFGYLPTAAAFAEGGYEPTTSVLTKAAEEDLTSQVITTSEGDALMRWAAAAMRPGARLRCHGQRADVYWCAREILGLPEGRPPSGYLRSRTTGFERRSTLHPRRSAEKATHAFSPLRSKPTASGASRTI